MCQKDRSAVHYVVWWMSLQLPTTTRNFQCASQASFPSACMCVWGWCVVLSLRSRVTPKQPPLQLHWHCAVRHRPDTDMVGHHDRASTLGIRHLQPLVDPEQVAGSAGTGPAAARNSDGAWVHREVCAGRRRGGDSAAPGCTGGILSRHLGNLSAHANAASKPSRGQQATGNTALGASRNDACCSNH